MATNRANIAKQLEPGLNAIFGMNYNAVEAQHLPLFEVEQSNRSYEEEVNMTGLGIAPVKPEGSPVEYDDVQETYQSRYNHETIAYGYTLTEEAFEDNLYDTFSKVRTEALARSMANTKQVKAANVFNLGFNASYPGGDGVPLFSAAHPVIDGGTQSNTAAVDLSETSLQDAQTAISLFQDDKGILIGARGQSLHIPPALEFTAFKILKSDLSTTTATNSGGITNLNDANAIRGLGYFSDGIYVNHRFVDSDAWFIKTNVPGGTKFFERVKYQTGFEGDFDTGNMKYKARERYSFGWSDWRKWYGSSG